MTKENEELKKRMSGVEEMVANLIVDQQAMARCFRNVGIGTAEVWKGIGPISTPLGGRLTASKSTSPPS